MQAVKIQRAGAGWNVIEIVENNKRKSPTEPSIGTVHLVGAGPGHIDYLTLKAYRLLRQAEVVVHDRLVSREILDLAPKEARRIFVGKAPNYHPMPQEEISRLLVRLARSGHEVVRLKGGDPFIFGRGSEEAAELARENVPFEVVPGITAASGCLATLGVPLTHRGVATGVRFVTGHCRKGVDLNLNWHSLADSRTTLVVYMGLANIEEMSRSLQAAGLPGDTAALAVSSGTTPKQQTCRTTLAGLPADIAAARLQAPVLIVIGQVVSSAEASGIANFPVSDFVQEVVLGG